MLILTRRPNETIVIGGNIRVTVLGFKGGQARIGIDAPSEVVIDREEIAQRKNAEQLYADRDKDAEIPPGHDPAK
jgi:carbon storage regulator